MKCRVTNEDLTHTLIDLGATPPSNSFLTEDDMQGAERYYPLKVFLNTSLYFGEIDEVKDASEIFDEDYVYYSSYSKSWLEHAKKYSDAMTSRFGLDQNSRVVEIASNDGYLLQYFLEKGISALGVEPCGKVADAAIEKGVETRKEFFTRAFAEELKRTTGPADLIAGNNVFAHVPDTNDFVSGIETLLNDDGVVTLEFPHLIKMIEELQFDTIYHEHFYYFSFLSAVEIFKKHGLTVFDVEELPTHGGSLRVFGQRTATGSRRVEESVEEALGKEKSLGAHSVEYYEAFTKKVNHLRHQFAQFMLDAQQAGRSVVGYGAAAKGNTFLNTSLPRNCTLDYVVDASPIKQGRYLPGTRIPVVSEGRIRETKPDYVLILPWNLKEEITNQLQYVREWDAKFVVATPRLEIF